MVTSFLMVFSSRCCIYCIYSLSALKAQPMNSSDLFEHSERVMTNPMSSGNASFSKLRLKLRKGD